MTSLIEELQAHALDRSISVNDLLRKAKVVADKLDIQEMREWVERELNGYAKDDNFPEYRKIDSEFQAYNPFHGWQPIIFPEPEKLEGLFEPRVLTTAAGQIEIGDHDYLFTLPQDIKARLIRSLEMPTDMRCLLNRSEVQAIPEIVRNQILDWSLKLEKAGVRGDGFSFSPREKHQAHTVSINVYGDVANLSNVGDVGEGSTIATHQTSSKQIDVKALATLADELRQNADSLVPADQVPRFVEFVDVIEAESKEATPNPGRLRTALTTAQSMLRAAVVNGGGTMIVKGAIFAIGESLKFL